MFHRIWNYLGSFYKSPHFFREKIIVMIMMLYILSPVDLAPESIFDDFIVLIILFFFGGKTLLTYLPIYIAENISDQFNQGQADYFEPKTAPTESGEDVEVEYEEIDSDNKD